MEEVLSSMAEARHPSIPQVSRKSNGFSRSDVVAAFNAAFEIIGGTSRLALWANANPDKFYPLFAKLLPSTTQLIGDAGALEIIHRIAPTALDDHSQKEPERYVYTEPERLVEDVECRELKEVTSPEDISVPSTPVTAAGAFSSRTGEQERQSPP